MYRMGLKGPVVKGIRAKLGGRLRLAIVGGAPCSVEVLRGFADLGIKILEGYGLTETAPILTFNPEDAPRPGSVGIPLPNVEVRIDDPNDEGVGEIIAQGPNIMKGYLNNEEATREAIRDGWFYTGDLGYIGDDGYVVITGRKKSLIVNREGKNIYPEEVESCVLQSDLVMEAVVLAYATDGETGEKVGIIVVPDQDALDARTGRKEQLSDEAVTGLLVEEVKRTTREIADYKRPRRIQVRTEEFEKTSTGKVKRYLYALTPSDV
jgi:long-chain acyl-CoA synthetase